MAAEGRPAAGLRRCLGAGALERFLAFAGEAFHASGLPLFSGPARRARRSIEALC